MKILLQQEWQFAQNKTPGVGNLFVTLETALRDDFLPDLLGVRRKEATYFLRKQITWGVKQEGIGIQHPTQTTPANFEILENCCEFFITSLLIEEAMDIRAHGN